MSVQGSGNLLSQWEIRAVALSNMVKLLATSCMNESRGRIPVGDPWYSGECTWAPRNAAHAVADREPTPVVSRMTLSVMDSSADDQSHAPTSDRISPARLPLIDRACYRPLGEVGRGGLGRVSRMRDTRLVRDVAVKEMLDPKSTRARRFLREALITARLQHPSIVPVYEVGHWPDGAPFYAMKLIAGETLAEALDRTRTLDERLAHLPSVISVINAVAYAHSRGVIHRDLKPANVVLGEFGEAVVVDWGLAKELEVDGAVREPARSAHELGLTTHVGAVIGTPLYMAPEQARCPDVDERADIYSLGAILYQVLTGWPPYGADREAGSGAEVLARLAKEPPLSVRTLAPTVPDELATIVECAMARAPDERYPRAEELAAELQRFSGGQLVRAHRYTLWALVKRWLYRHRALVSLAAVMLLALIVTGSVGVWQVLEQRDDARANFRLARQRQDRLIVAQAELVADPTAAVAWLRNLPDDADNWAQARSVAVVARNRGIARHVWQPHSGSIGALAVSPNGALLASGSEDRTVWLRALATGTAQTLRGPTDWIRDLQFAESPPHWLAAVDKDGGLWVWDQTGVEVYRRSGPHGYDVRVRWSPVEPVLAVFGVNEDIAVHDPESGAVRILIGHRSRVERLAFSPDGQWLASADATGEICLWALAAGRCQVRLGGRTGERVFMVAFTADGQSLVSVGADDALRVWALPSGHLRASHDHGSDVFRLAVAPRGEAIITADDKRIVRLFAGPDGPPQVLGEHGARIYGVDFSADGAWAASWDADGEIRLWDVATGTWRRSLVGHRDEVGHVVFDPSGTRMWSSGLTDGIREWDLVEKSWRRVHGPPGNGNSLAVSPDGQEVVAGYGLGGVVLWELTRGRHRQVIEHRGNVMHLAFLPSGDGFVSAAWDGQIFVYDRKRDEARRLGQHGQSVWRFALSARGDSLATVAGDRSARVWTLPGGEFTPVPMSAVSGVAYAPDGELLAATGRDGSVRLFARTGPESTWIGRSVGAHEGAAGSVTFAPDGQLLLSHGTDGKLRLWDLEGNPRGSRTGHPHGLRMARFSVEHSWLVSLGYEDWHASLWNLDTGASRTIALPKPLDAAWLPGSTQVLITCDDARMRIIDAQTGAMHIFAELPAVADRLRITADGRKLIFLDRAQDIHVWYDDVPRDPAALRVWLTRASSATIDFGRPLQTPAWPDN